VETLEKQEGKKLRVKSVDSSSTFVTEGVSYDLRLELNSKEVIDVSILEQKPQVPLLATGPTSAIVRYPELPPMQLRGPMEFTFSGGLRQISLRIPKDVDPGLVSRVILAVLSLP
jgi:hypothetical protein